ncbi:hypothetical protein [Pelagibaculum spongiae]|uniref:Uncharacterized protein n=1 Tax=Pelagibaculum spongiae TaxID=2080658 RepID=A0A2V1GUL1_9GAMM|nr:hypothetical protein [Pelagibaculum spongiae]PVZ67730.1 hypothetical protein DC094_14955 [Pelagibaculum spongiae]
MFDQHLFNKELNIVSDKYKNLENKFSWLEKYNEEDAYQLYKNASRSKLGFLVCGRTRINTSRDRFRGSSIEEIELSNLGTTNHSCEIRDPRASFSGCGSVLHYNTSWHFLLNDAWLLGGIHAQIQFHLASPRHRDNIINPSGSFLTVTGRELIGLVAFGYRFVKSKNTEQEIAVPFDIKKARNANFEQYWIAIDRQNDGKDIDKSLIDPAANLVTPQLKNVGIWNKYAHKKHK